MCQYPACTGPMLQASVQYRPIAGTVSVRAVTTNAAFTVHFSSDEDEWEGSFNVPIHAPLLTVSNPSFTDNGGDGGGDDGETITFYLLLNNEGSSGIVSL